MQIDTVAGQGAIVTAFPNFTAMEGAEATTDAEGICDLDLGPSALTLDRLYVHPPLGGFWGSYLSSVPCSGSHFIEIEPVQASYIDALAHFYGLKANVTDGQNVIVGVVDTGIDNKHADLSHVTVGVNTAKGEPWTLWQDNGTGHGTHVAGISVVAASSGLGWRPASSPQLSRLPPRQHRDHELPGHEGDGLCHGTRAAISSTSA